MSILLWCIRDVLYETFESLELFQFGLRSVQKLTLDEITIIRRLEGVASSSND